jgi:hypothetical protein
MALDAGRTEKFGGKSQVNNTDQKPWQLYSHPTIRGRLNPRANMPINAEYVNLNGVQDSGFRGQEIQTPASFLNTEPRTLSNLCRSMPSSRTIAA